MHVVTDHKYAPMFADWMEKHLGIRFGPEARFIANVIMDDDQFEIVGCTALDSWTLASCEAHACSDGSKRQKIDHRYIWTTFDYAFNHAEKNCMMTHVAVDNLKSLALQELLGLKKVGLVEGFYGPDKDAYLFAITKQQWLDGKWGSLEPEGVI